MTVRSPLCLAHKVAFSILAVLLCVGVALPLSARSKERERARKAAAKAPKEQTYRVQRPAARVQGGDREDEGTTASMADGTNPWAGVNRKPREQRMGRSRSWDGDVRSLPQTPPRRRERPEFEAPALAPRLLPGGPETQAAAPPSSVAPQSAPAPAATTSFEGLDFATWGAGHPPDTNGDVGPNHYIETVNTSIGIYDKAAGTLISGFTFNTFMSQGHFGNLCDTDNFGDPVVVYDTFEDRWVITDFAFKLVSGNVAAPSFQCFAVSKTGDPVAGGWNFYSISTTDAFGDYPKFGIWPDGLYMTANMFGFGAGGGFRGVRVWAFNKTQMYAGLPTVQIVSFDAPPGDFTILPSNARLQAGTPAPGTPNYYAASSLFLNALTVYKFHVDWNRISLSTFSGPDTPIAATSWPNQTAASAPSQGGNNLDVLATRAMMQNQYTNIGGAESLWMTHTVRRVLNGTAAPRWYQVDVTGGTVHPSLPQAATWDPDGTNVMNRFVPSVAVDRAGNMALGYSTSNSATKPAIKYAGRLASDPVNTFSQTEQLLIQGTGTQVGNCGPSACTRWGDYSAMTLDPDGCRFWYTTEYYQVDGLNDNTRIGAFSYPSCTPLANNGVLQGTVTAAGSGATIAGATVALGSRMATTDSSGFYSFIDLPAGTYPTLTASSPGFASASASNVVVSDDTTTTQDFALADAARTACFTDTTQADFQAGVSTNCDLTTSPGDVTLINPPTIDQQNTSISNSGNGITTTAWSGQTFLAALSGPLVRADVFIFCSGCTGTAPNLTLSVRATSAGLPTGPDLATATIPGNPSGSGGYYTANFASPVTVTAGTTYALALRPSANPSAGIYAPIRSAANAYANGARVTSADSGVTWVAQTTDLGFKIYIQTGFVPSGTFTSSTKDANPTPGAIVNWGTLNWTADTPAGTAITFQAAASNSASGPFTFVGPDSTPATFFASGDSLAQFNGMRYLKYQATLTTTSPSSTPSLHDVNICFDDVPSPTVLSVNPALGQYGGTADLAAVLTSGGPGVSGRTIDFSINGIPVGSAVTDAGGVALLPGASLAGINVGFYPTGVTASFTGDAGYGPSAGSGPLMVMPAPATVILGSLTAVYNGLPHAATATTVPPGLVVTFTYDGSPTPPTNAGSYTVVGTIADPNYFGFATGTLTIDKATAGIVISGLGPYIYDALPKSATVTTTPPGLVVTVTYDGGTALPVSIGPHAVVATVVDANYAGTASATLVIGPPIAATMVSPTPGSTLTGPSATFTWAGFGGATQYWLSVGTTLGGTNLFDASTGTSLSRTVIHLPVDGSTIFVRLFTNAGGVWLFNDYTYVAVTTAKAAMLTPAPGSTLTGPSATFTWSTGTGAIAYWLTVGTTAGGNQIYDAAQGTALTQTVLGLPVNGSTVYVRLWTNLLGAGWQFTDYTYTAASASLAAMTSPTPGSTLGSSATFTWSTGSGVGPYWLWVGTTLGGTQIYDAGQGMATSHTVSGIPHTGGTIFVRLWSLVPGSGWQFVDYTYAATVDLVGVITSPTPGSTLSGSTVTFTWDPGTGGLEYWLYVGTTAGGSQIYTASQGLATSHMVTGIPTNGSTLFVRLWTRMPGSGWQFRDFTYTTGP